ncbi:hypothetical protein FA95DRAFT_1604124 [Auriscalpium vulgare]|uniref:Uncharacterized protein n=1 Tax=Auriscalpium vulgare TaxID=40419 RepID=A0ACB8S0K0_9AGAM|nr:hypothetical protein FA95DRAFT_1604124 [Auriscalpium vulgare]
MSPSAPTPSIKVHVPRHNTQRIGPALTAQVEAVAREKGIRTDIRQPTNEPQSALALAIENASHWNSMLLTARAERGPAWDVGTQQFHVDEGSELYFDPSPLLDYQKEDKPEPPPHPSSSQQQLPSTPLQAHRSRPPQSMGNQYPMNGMGISPGMQQAMRPGMPGGGYPGVQFGHGGVPPGQFYGGDRQSPMMTRGMSMDGMGISPDVRRRL